MNKLKLNGVDVFFSLQYGSKELEEITDYLDQTGIQRVCFLDPRFTMRIMDLELLHSIPGLAVEIRCFFEVKRSTHPIAQFGESRPDLFRIKSSEEPEALVELGEFADGKTLLLASSWPLFAFKAVGISYPGMDADIRLNITNSAESFKSTPYLLFNKASKCAGKIKTSGIPPTFFGLQTKQDCGLSYYNQIIAKFAECILCNGFADLEQPLLKIGAKVDQIENTTEKLLEDCKWRVDGNLSLIIDIHEGYLFLSPLFQALQTQTTFRTVILRNTLGYFGDPALTNWIAVLDQQGIETLVDHVLDIFGNTDPRIRAWSTHRHNGFTSGLFCTDEIRHDIVEPWLEYLAISDGNEQILEVSYRLSKDGSRKVATARLQSVSTDDSQPPHPSNPL